MSKLVVTSVSPSTEPLHPFVAMAWAKAELKPVRATPKSNSVDNVQALQGDATVLEDVIKL